jgi:Transglutaminase-like superfamily
MFSFIALSRKFWQLPCGDRLLLLEAILSLAAARFVIAALPFRYVGHLAARPVRGPDPPWQARQREIHRIRWAVFACARRVPWRAMCFEQGLASQFMLRRRDVPSVLYYGATTNGRYGLAAHVWVRDGDVDVIGGERASFFGVLATFPPIVQSSLERQRPTFP